MAQYQRESIDINLGSLQTFTYRECLFHSDWSASGRHCGGELDQNDEWSDVALIYDVFQLIECPTENIQRAGDKNRR